MTARVLKIMLGFLASSVVAAATYFFQKDRILDFFKGKKLAVLGARGVGKTHLIKFLTSGSIPEKYKQTVAPEKTNRRRFYLKELEINVKDTLDVSGDESQYHEWKKLHNESDIIFYLLRADRLVAGDKKTETRVLDDLHHIGSWLEAKSPRPHVFLIGTHCDLDSNFREVSPDRRGDYNDTLRRLPVINDLVLLGGGADLVKVVFGSMETLPDTEDLVYQIFSQVA